MFAQAHDGDATKTATYPEWPAVRAQAALQYTAAYMAEIEAAVSQEMVLRAAFMLVLTGIYDRVQWKYVDRSYRYLLLEAGHLGQNVYLAATALGLGPCGIGAYFDDDLNRLVGVDGRDEATVYLMAIGPTSREAAT